MEIYWRFSQKKYNLKTYNIASSKPWSSLQIPITLGLAQVLTELPEIATWTLGMDAK